ncbi:ABC transporter permease [Aestuariicella hydrocarbonica]|uniref:ABC transporter permease n=1 Tax=Pseudomaricurvus hydrocarbonicus TaxID=1470433 RepID=A0A9E5MLQ0_9GAMM|nr:ABC transporter permease [Aestuariicella hydrocarbonica]NHO65153.1 ABC transporter permease [Aestuariicella hydrocarbonica]
MTTITWWGLMWCLLPIALVSGIYFIWHGKPSEVLISSARMVIQLVGVGYVLVFLFDSPSPWTSLAVVTLMLAVASWIAIRPVRGQPGYFQPALLALLISVSFHLLLSLKLVMAAETWYTPNLFIPLAGMYLANTMNALSLSAERYHAELRQGNPVAQARLTAFNAAMIPQINGLLAVGLVALPGMMTGQILSGISPLIAVRYQIMIMAMVLGCSGVGSAILLWSLRNTPLAHTLKPHQPQKGKEPAAPDA